MSNKKYKLTYFNGRGRAEISRLIFAAAGVDYEDCRLEGQQWPKIKPTTPNGSLPLLEFDGMVICQSMTIARYLARQFGLAGKNPVEELRADMIVACLDDLMSPILPFMFEKDEAKKKEQTPQLNEKLATALGYLEKLLVSNKGGNGHFVGDQLTWADLHFYNGSYVPEKVGLTIDWSLYPRLAALKDRVCKLPKITAWVQKRPESSF